MTIQERYDKLTWWGKFIVQLNPEIWTLRWRVEELEKERAAPGAPEEQKK